VHDTKAIDLLRKMGTDNIPLFEDIGDNQSRQELLAAMMEIPICTDEERFAQPTKWAVMKEGQKKAVKLFDNKADAEGYLWAQTDTIARKLSVTERKGGYQRCLWYCNVAKFCPHVKKELDNQPEGV